MGEGDVVNGIGHHETVGSLDLNLEHYAGSDLVRATVADAVRAIARTSADLDIAIANWEFDDQQRQPDAARDDGDRPNSLDLIAGDLLTEALNDMSAALIGLDKHENPAVTDVDAKIAVVIDPLNGASAADTNIPAGTIFAILPMMADLEQTLLQPGHRLIAAGFVIYGPQTCLVLTLGDGTDIYKLDRQDRSYLCIRSAVEIAADGDEYAIDASNYRHWDKPIQAYIDENVDGADGPRGRNFTTHWTGSLVAEAYRILVRGGIFLYPGDRREGYEKGRHRLIHEANPLAMIFEQAGGLATDGEDRILDIQPHKSEQRVPLMFGSRDKVERVRNFHDGTLSLGERSPLFGHRGLFRH